MPFISAPTDYDSFASYLRDIGVGPSYHLRKCVECGLGAVGVYMKAIGQEEEYFKRLKQSKDQSIMFRDFFYEIFLTTRNAKFFPQLPQDMLKIELPLAYQDAEITVKDPDFQLVCSFNADQLQQVLFALTTNAPGMMLRIGTKQMMFGVILTVNEYGKNEYSLFYAGKESRSVYSTPAGCVGQIFMQLQAKNEVVLYVDRCDLSERSAKPVPSWKDFLSRFLANASDDDKQNILYAAVQAGLIEEVKFLHEQKVPFNGIFAGNINIMRLAVAAKDMAMIKLLAMFPEVDRHLAREDALHAKNKDVLALLPGEGMHDHAHTFLPSQSRPGSGGPRSGPGTGRL